MKGDVASVKVDEEILTELSSGRYRFFNDSAERVKVYAYLEISRSSAIPGSYEVFFGEELSLFDFSHRSESPGAAYDNRFVEWLKENRPEAFI